MKDLIIAVYRNTIGRCKTLNKIFKYIVYGLDIVLNIAIVFGFFIFVAYLFILLVQ